MSSAVRLIRNHQLAQTVDYAYVASTRRQDLVTAWDAYQRRPWLAQAPLFT